MVGASRGIGRATVLELASRGHDVALAFASNVAAAEKVAAELPSACSSVLIQCDIGADATVVVERAVAALGGLDSVVVTPAPIIVGPIHKVTAEEARRACDVMVHGFREVVLAARPYLAERQGAVVAVSSAGSERVAGWYGALGPAKAALEATVRYLAVSLGRDLIRVNAVSPGMVDDPAHFADAPEIMDLLPATAKRTPLGQRLPGPADIARTIAALLSDDTSFVTGHVLKIDGGYSLTI